MTLMTGHRWHEEIMLNSLDDGHNLLPNPSRRAARAGGGETFGCVAVCSTMPSWFRPKMKLDPKANDRVRSSWRLRKSTPSSFREEPESVHDTCANGVMGSVR